MDPVLTELAITKVIAKQEGTELDANKIAEDFVYQYNQEAQIKKLHERLDKLRDVMSTGNTFHGTVIVDMENARNTLVAWREKRNDALAKDVAFWQGVITTFTAAATLAAGPAGSLSIAAIIPIATGLVQTISAAAK